MSDGVVESSSVTDLLTQYDLASLLDPSLHEMEQKFQGSTLFKYYPKQRRGFFRDPKIRFTQKTALNDRFELTKRWHEFGSAPVRAHVVAHLRQSIHAKLNELDYINDRVVKEFADRGQNLTSEQREFISKQLKSTEGEAMIAHLKAQANDTVEPLANMFFDQLASNSDAFIEEQVRELGIFSVSETATNDQLWALYAEEGRGFIVSFNARHDFFRTGSNGTVAWPLFHKVTYTDDRIDDFWRNPLYLFAVKKKRWSFEEEWRMIKSRADCDETISISGEDIFLCNVRPGMVESITFGYAYDVNELNSDMADFAEFDVETKFQRAIIDDVQGCISIIPLKRENSGS